MASESGDACSVADATSVRADATDGIRHFACTRAESVRRRIPDAHRTTTALALVLVFCTSCRRESPRPDTTSAPPAAGATAPNVAGVASAAPSGPAARPYRMSPRGLERIRQREAYVARVYDDGVGNRTVGYGHMLRHGESFPQGLSMAEAEELFAKDVDRIVSPVLDRIKVPLTQNQVDAIGSFVFNVGPGNFSRSILPNLNRGDHEGVVASMFRFVTGRNQRTGERVTLRGLLKRRQEEVALYRAPAGSASLRIPGRNGRVRHVGCSRTECSSCARSPYACSTPAEDRARRRDPLGVHHSRPRLDERHECRARQGRYDAVTTHDGRRSRRATDRRRARPRTVEDSVYVFIGDTDSTTVLLKQAHVSWEQYRKLECDAIRVAFAGDRWRRSPRWNAGSTSPTTIGSSSPRSTVTCATADRHRRPAGRRADAPRRLGRPHYSRRTTTKLALDAPPLTATSCGDDSRDNDYRFTGQYCCTLHPEVPDA